MIRRKEDVRIRQVEHAQKGKGTVTFHDWLLPEEAKGHGRVFSKVVIPPGSSIGFHQHLQEFEAYYVLQGQALVRDGENEVLLHPGDMNLCPDGHWHGVENVGQDDVVLIALIMNQLA